jgi:hypothetical protein
VTSYHIPPTVRVGVADIYCSINTANESATVQIALDAARGVIVLKHEEGHMVGSYNPQTGAISFADKQPRAVSAVGTGVTYYAQSGFDMNGVVNAATGAITGSYSERSVNTWTLDATQQECTTAGTFTAVKL